jgi:hypothetical protein
LTMYGQRGSTRAGGDHLNCNAQGPDAIHHPLGDPGVEPIMGYRGTFGHRAHHQGAMRDRFIARERDPALEVLNWMNNESQLEYSKLQRFSSFHLGQEVKYYLWPPRDRQIDSKFN